MFGWLVFFVGVQLTSLMWRCASGRKVTFPSHTPPPEDLWDTARKVGEWVGEWHGCLKAKKDFGNNHLAISRMSLTQALVQNVCSVWEPAFSLILKSPGARARLGSSYMLATPTKTTAEFLTLSIKCLLCAKHFPEPFCLSYHTHPQRPIKQV